MALLVSSSLGGAYLVLAGDAPEPSLSTRSSSDRAAGDASTGDATRTDGSDGSPLAKGGSTDSTARGSTSEAQNATNPWRSLPPTLRKRMGVRGLQPLLSGTSNATARPSQPESLTELMDRLAGTRIRSADAERLAVPDAPAGDDPVMTALGTYAATMGFSLPAEEELRPQVEALGLTENGERALAQLILAYSRAVELQRNATAQLSDQEKAFVRMQPEVLDDWFQANRSRTFADYERRVARLLTKVNFTKTLQAADMLSRTIDVVRPILEAAKPTAPDPGAAAPSRDDGASADSDGSASADGGDAASTGAGAGSADAESVASTDAEPSPDRTTGASPSSSWGSDPWRLADRLLRASRPNASKIPADVGAQMQAVPSLGDALVELAKAHDAPTPNRTALDARLDRLPPSLSNALARIVHAKAVGIESGNAVIGARLMQRAVRRSQPTLEAWSALLDSSRSRTAAAVSGPNRSALLGTAIQSTPSPTRLVANAHGLPTPTPSADVPPLYRVLIEQGVPEDAAREVQASWSAATARGVARALHGVQQLNSTRTEWRQNLTAGQRDAIDALPPFQRVLREDRWSRAEARFVADTARNLSGVDYGRLRRAQVQALADVETAKALLTGTPLTLDGSDGLSGSQTTEDGLETDQTTTHETSSSHTGVACQELPIGLSDCEDDIWFRFGSGRSTIAVTGPHSTTISAETLESGGLEPLLVVDLGGDDNYTIGAGSASLVPSIVLDTGGDDRYTNRSRFAQGSGILALGALWDVDGDDTYVHEPDEAGGAQGYADLEGVGLLVDGGGTDTYRASSSLAQGFGDAVSVAGVLEINVAGGIATGGVGILADLGDGGSETFTALRGQGSTNGTAAVGLLINRGGDSTYVTTKPDSHSQGGTRGTGLGALVDLDGDDSYSNPAVDQACRGDFCPANGTPWRDLPQVSSQRKDHAIWLDTNLTVASPTRAIGFGIDTTLDDTDGDQAPGAVELLAGSDPDNASSQPDEGIEKTAGVVDDWLTDRVDEVENMTRNSDADNEETRGFPTPLYPDAVEEEMCSDPHDGQDKPISSQERDSEPPDVDPDNPEEAFEEGPAKRRRGYDLLTVTAPRGRDAPDPPLLTADPATPNSLGRCPGILLLGLAGGSPNTHDTPAVISVELGGDDRYINRTAGPGLGVGSVHVDLQGDDDYTTPDLDHTQGSAINGSSILLDLDGNDIYKAGHHSQGAAGADIPAKTGELGGVGLLIDPRGDDRYEGGGRSQGYAAWGLASTGSGNRRAGFFGGLLDTNGTDRYFFRKKQAFAEAAARPGADGSGTTSKAAAFFVDTEGSDRYETTRLIDTTSMNCSSPLRRLQGWSAIRGGSSPFFTPGTFAGWLDSQGSDTFVVRAGEGQREARNKNGVAGPCTDSEGGAVWASAYLDLNRNVGQEDSDGDGRSDTFEQLLGSDPQDPDDTPGSATGDDPVGGVSKDGEPWLEAYPGGRPSVEIDEPTFGSHLALTLPGVAIGGTGDTRFRKAARGLVVDLGGDDTYEGQGTGGVRSPVRETSLVGLEGSAIVDSPVSAVVDLRAPGTSSDDVYRSDRHVVRSPAKGKDLNAVATNPSFGGAILGVGLVVDTAGSNSFQSNLSLKAVTQGKVQGSQDAKDTRGRATAYGVTQGAGVFGGIGVLATVGSDNLFQVNVTATAKELQPQARRTSPEARAFGLGHGAGWMGIGALATFGRGRDDYRVELSASAPQGVHGAQDLAQGAARSGMGLLLDRGGSNRFEARRGRSQGFSSVIAPLHDAGADDPGREVPTGVSQDRLNNHGLRRIARPSIGLLWSGPGDDRYTGGPASQGVGIGSRHEVLSRAWTGHDDAFVLTRPVVSTIGGAGGSKRDATASRAAPAAGLVLDGGGSDAYRVVAGSELVQGAGIVGGIGSLVDVSGDDRYTAEQGRIAQGAGMLGHGILVDGGGHDAYRADRRAQGYASDLAILLSWVRACQGGAQTLNPHYWLCPHWTHMGLNNNQDLETGGHQAGASQQVLRIPEGLPTTGALVDLQGRDRYELTTRGQGYASASLSYLARGGFCRNQHLSGPIFFVGDPVPEAAPWLSPCPSKRFPDEESPDDEHQEKGENLPGNDWESPWIEGDNPIGPPMDAPILGLLADTGGQDHYEYPQGFTDQPVEKQPFDPRNLRDRSRPMDDNDWIWTQTDTYNRTLNQTGLPQDNFEDDEEIGHKERVKHEEEVGGEEIEVDEEVGVFVDPEPHDDPSCTKIADETTGTDECTKNRGDTGHAVFGGGIDQDAYGRVSDQTKSAAGDPSVTLQIYEDSQWTNKLEDGEHTNGTLHLRGRVDPGSFRRDQVQRVTFFLDGKQLGRGHFLRETGNGNLLYNLTWRTRLPSDTARSQAYPDDIYNVSAAAWFGPDDPGTGFVGAPDGVSDKSQSRSVPVDNPPLVDVALRPGEDARRLQGAVAISPPRGQTAELSVRVSPDLRFPDGIQDRSGRPGAYLAADAVGPHDHPLIAPTYVNGGQGTTLNITGAQCSETASYNGSLCDGLYDVAIDVQDAGGKDAEVPVSKLLYDGTPPTSHLDPGMEPYADASYQRSFGSKLLVRWAFQDALAGVDTIARYRLDASLDIEEKTVYGRGAGRPVTFDTIDHSPGSTYRFVTVAVDRLGNRQTGCVSPCAQSWIQDHPQAVLVTTPDFSPPQIRNVEITPDYVSTDTEATYDVTVRDDGPSGIDPDNVSVVYQGERHPASRDSPGDETFTATIPFGDAFEGAERRYAVKIFARDRAGNLDSQTATGILDGSPPDVLPKGVSYEVQGRSRTVGRPGALASVFVHVEDDAPGDSLSSVRANFSSVAPEVALESCTPAPTQDDPDRWACRVVLPQDIADGTYRVPLVAEDKAGNRNATQSATIGVNTSPVAITDVSVVSRGHDRVTLAWETDRNATSQVRYGKTSDLGQVTSLNRSLVQDHRATVTGLSPSTDYFFRTVSSSGAGVENTSRLHTVTTRSAIGLGFRNVTAGDVWSGQENTTVNVTLFGIEDPAELRVLLKPDDKAASPLPVTTIKAVSNATEITIDTASFPDGRYRLLLEASRLGDFNSTTSPPIRIDNTPPAIAPLAPAPGGVTNASRPTIAATVLDPLTSTAPPLSTLQVRLDGQPLNVSAAYQSNGSGGPQRILHVEALEPIGDGEHTFNLSLADVAGNPTSVNWSFHVDASGPALRNVTVEYRPGPAAARPGGRINVSVEISALTRVTDAAVDLRPIGGTGWVDLKSREGDRWSAVLDVPSNATGGTVALALQATDALNTTVTVPRAVPVSVDATPPVLKNVRTDAVGHTRAKLSVGASEPIRLDIEGQSSKIHVATEAFSTATSLELTGLDPGTSYTLVVTGSDDAGNVDSATTTVTTEEDATPPDAPGDLQATSSREGVVNLTWSASSDNVAVDHYRVERLGASTATFRVPANRTAFHDEQAPAGRKLTYRVFAVDVAGLESKAAERSVRALALPHLRNASVTPKQGDARTEFTFRVTYRHAAGKMPDNLTLATYGSTYDLQPVRDDPDCVTGCVFEAAVRLDPTSVQSATEEATFRAVTDGHDAVASIDAPLVSGGELTGGRLTPGLATTTAIVGMAAAALALNRRRGGWKR